MKHARHLPVNGAYNIRDLGGYTTRNGGTVPWRRFLRADSLHRIAAGDVTGLHNEGLRAVIDLRTPYEVVQAQNPFAKHPEVHFANLPLFDDLSPQALSKSKADGEHPLLGFYTAAVETRGTAICAILTEIADVETGAVLFNCTAGKDRTGIIAALLLGIAGVPHDQIVADYTMTEALIPDLVAEFLELSRARGGDTVSYARLLESPGATMATTLAQIDARYGGISEYLENIGLSRRVVDILHKRLTQTGA